MEVSRWSQWKDGGLDGVKGEKGPLERGKKPEGVIDKLTGGKKNTGRENSSTGEKTWVVRGK